MKKLNPDNKCSKLFKKIIKPKKDGLKEIWEKQEEFQKSLKILHDQMPFVDRMQQIDKQWRNLCIEFGELMERLPYKEWKSYPVGKLCGIFKKEETT